MRREVQRTDKGKSPGLSPPARFHGKMGSGRKLDSASVRCLFSAGRPAEATQRGPLARPRGGFDVYAIVSFLKCVIYCDFFRHSKYTSTFYT